MRPYLVLFLLAALVVVAQSALSDAHAFDDDDSAGDGVDCYPDPGPCGDQPTLAPVQAAKFDEACDADDDGYGDLVLVAGDPHDYSCWALACVGSCYEFEDLPGLVWKLVDVD